MTTEAHDGRIRPTKSNPRTYSVGVVGVGGGGGNIVSYLCKHGIDKVDFYAINTDRQALDELHPDIETIQIGDRKCDGEGAGGDPEVGRDAAQENTQLLMSKFNEKRLLFVVSCMGGGTGSGASPVIADLAAHENQGLLTVAILTTPSGGEGDQTVVVAEAGIQAMRSQVDAMMVVPNDKEGVGMRKRHREINNLVFEKIEAITRLLAKTQVPNVDMADLKATLSQSNGNAAGMFIGTASLDPNKSQHDEGLATDSQARFKGLLDQALASDWLNIDFSAPIDEGRGILSFTIGGDEDDDDIDDITDESSIKRIVEALQTGASQHKLKIASYVDSELPKGTMKATVVLRASHAAHESGWSAQRKPDAFNDPAEFDPASLPTGKEVADINDGAEDFESHVGGIEETSPSPESLNFTENADATTELTRKNPS